MNFRSIWSRISFKSIIRSHININYKSTIAEQKYINLIIRHKKSDFKKSRLNYSGKYYQLDPPRLPPP